MHQIYKISYSWYWSIVTLFTTGYGDITATNEEEQWTASACILLVLVFLHILLVF